MSGHDHPEQAVTFKRNGRSRWAGICIAESLGRLAAFEKLLKTVMECEVEDLKFKINIDQRNSIDGLMEFSSAHSPDSVKPLEDALNEVLDRFGRSGRNS